MPPAGHSYQSFAGSLPHESDHEFRPLLQRSYSGAPPYGEQPYQSNGQRPITQFRRMSYRPPTSNNSNHSRAYEPYARPTAIRPATSPAPYPGLYGNSTTFSSSRGPLATKAEPNSPAGQHSHQLPYQQTLPQHFNDAAASAQYGSASPANSHNLYPGLQQSSHTAPGQPAHLHNHQYHQVYNSSEHAVQSAPSRPTSGFTYQETAPTQFHNPDYDGGSSALPYQDTYQEIQSAPAYTETFRQRPSHSGPIRQHFAPKLEDPT